jgi:hypothetical protein
VRRFRIFILVSSLISLLHAGVFAGDPVAFPGQTVTLSVTANGTQPFTYRWFKNGAPLPDEAMSELKLVSVTEKDSAGYSVEVSNAAGAARSLDVTLTVLDESEPPSPTPLEPVQREALRLTALSLRAPVDREPLIAGVAVDAALPVPFLFRAAGPSLSAFGVGDAMPNPVMTLYSGATQVAANDDWGVGQSSSLLSQLFTLAGAFPFLNSWSRDAALFAEVSGNRTAVLKAADGIGGTVLFEVYDLSRSGSGQLRTISARGHVSGGTGALVLGFALIGDGSRTVLLRGAGPALRLFGIVDALNHPQLRLHRVDASGAKLIAETGAWKDTPALQSAIREAGAFSFPIGSADAAMLAELGAGTYTLTLEDFEGTAGVALAEAYLLP